MTHIPYERKEIIEKRFFQKSIKDRNITKFPGVKILWKGTAFTKFRGNHLKLCGSCAFSQNFRTRKLGESSVFFAVEATADALDADSSISRFNLYRDQI